VLTRRYRLIVVKKFSATRRCLPISGIQNRCSFRFDLPGMIAKPRPEERMARLRS
jgi:hypothetical protein